MNKSSPNFWLYAAIFTLAVLLRVVGLNNQGLWSDEQCSVRDGLGQGVLPPDTPITSAGKTELRALVPKSVSIRPGDIFTPQIFWKNNNLKGVLLATLTVENGNSLAYNVALHYWFKFFGFSELTTRLFSVLLGVLIVLFGAWFIRTHFKSERLAVIGGFLLSVHPLLITYSREARSYSMTVFFGLLASHLFLVLLRPKQKATLGLGFCYFLSVALTVFSHYLGAYLFVVHGIFALIYARPLKKLLLFTASMVAFCMVFAVWFQNGALEGYHLMAEHGAIWKERSLTTLPDLKLGVGTTSLAFLKVLASLFNVRSLLSDKLVLGSHLPLYFISLLTLIAYALGFMRAWKRKLFDKLKIRFAVALALSCPVIALLMAIRSEINLSLLYRYSIFSAPFAVILVAVAICDIRKATKFGDFFISVVVGLQFVLFTAVSLLPMYLVGPVQRANRYLEIAKRIEARYKPNDMVVYSNLVEANMVSLYLGPKSTVRAMIDSQIAGSLVLLKNTAGVTTIADASLIEY